MPQCVFRRSLLDMQAGQRFMTLRACETVTLGLRHGQRPQRTQVYRRIHLRGRQRGRDGGRDIRYRIIFGCSGAKP